MNARVNSKPRVQTRWTDVGPQIQALNDELTVVKAEVRRLTDELADAQAEIRRHHADFQRWEDLAAKGAESLEERRRLRTIATAAHAYREADRAWGAAQRDGRLTPALNERHHAARVALWDALDAGGG